MAKNTSKSAVIPWNRYQAKQILTTIGEETLNPHAIIAVEKNMKKFTRKGKGNNWN